MSNVNNNSVSNIPNYVEFENQIYINYPVLIQAIRRVSESVLLSFCELQNPDFFRLTENEKQNLSLIRREIQLLSNNQLSEREKAFDEIVTNALDAYAFSKIKGQIIVTIDNDQFSVTDIAGGMDVSSISCFLNPGSSSNKEAIYDVSHSNRGIRGRFGTGGSTAPLTFILPDRAKSIPLFHFENMEHGLGTQLEIPYSDKLFVFKYHPKNTPCQTEADSASCVTCGWMDERKWIKVESKRESSVEVIHRVFDDQIFTSVSPGVKIDRGTTFTLCSPYIMSHKTQIINRLRRSLKYISDRDILVNGEKINQHNANLKLSFQGGSMFATNPTQTREGKLVICEKEKPIVEFSTRGFVCEILVISFDVLKLTQDRGSIDFEDKETRNQLINWLDKFNQSSPPMSQALVYNSLEPILQKQRYDLIDSIRLKVRTDWEDKLPMLPDIFEEDSQLFNDIMLLHPSYYPFNIEKTLSVGNGQHLYLFPHKGQSPRVAIKKYLGEWRVFVSPWIINGNNRTHFKYNLLMLNKLIELVTGKKDYIQVDEVVNGKFLDRSSHWKKASIAHPLPVKLEPAAEGNKIYTKDALYTKYCKDLGYNEYIKDHKDVSFIEYLKTQQNYKHLYATLWSAPLEDLEIEKNNATMYLELTSWFTPWVANQDHYFKIIEDDQFINNSSLSGMLQIMCPYISFGTAVSMISKIFEKLFEIYQNENKGNKEEEICYYLNFLDQIKYFPKKLNKNRLGISQTNTFDEESFEKIHYIYSRFRPLMKKIDDSSLKDKKDFIFVCLCSEEMKFLNLLEKKLIQSDRHFEKKILNQLFRVPHPVENLSEDLLNLSTQTLHDLLHLLASGEEFLEFESRIHFLHFLTHQGYEIAMKFLVNNKTLSMGSKVLLWENFILFYQVKSIQFFSGKYCSENMIDVTDRFFEFLIPSFSRSTEEETKGLLNNLKDCLLKINEFQEVRNILEEEFLGLDSTEDFSEVFQESQWMKKLYGDENTCLKAITELKNSFLELFPPSRSVVSNNNCSSLSKEYDNKALSKFINKDIENWEVLGFVTDQIRPILYLLYLNGYTTIKSTDDDSIITHETSLKLHELQQIVDVFGKENSKKKVFCAVHQCHEKLNCLKESIKNSFEAGASRVDVNVFKCREMKGIVLEIKDNGQGMSPEDFISFVVPWKTTKINEMSPDQNFGWGAFSNYHYADWAYIQTKKEGFDTIHFLVKKMNDELHYRQWEEKDNRLPGTIIKLFRHSEDPLTEKISVKIKLIESCRHVEGEIYFEGDRINLIQKDHTLLSVETPYTIGGEVKGTISAHLGLNAGLYSNKQRISILPEKYLYLVPPVLKELMAKNKLNMSLHVPLTFEVMNRTAVIDEKTMLLQIQFTLLQLASKYYISLAFRGEFDGNISEDCWSDFRPHILQNDSPFITNWTYFQNFCSEFTHFLNSQHPAKIALDDQKKMILRVAEIYFNSQAELAVLSPMLVQILKEDQRINAVDYSEQLKAFIERCLFQELTRLPLAASKPSLREIREAIKVELQLRGLLNDQGDYCEQFILQQDSNQIEILIRGAIANVHQSLNLDEQFVNIENKFMEEIIQHALGVRHTINEFDGQDYFFSKIKSFFEEISRNYLHKEILVIPFGLQNGVRAYTHPQSNLFYLNIKGETFQLFSEMLKQAEASPFNEEQFEDGIPKILKILEVLIHEHSHMIELLHVFGTHNAAFFNNMLRLSNHFYITSNHQSGSILNDFKTLLHSESQRNK